MMRAMMLPAEPTEDGGVGIVMHFARYKVRLSSLPLVLQEYAISSHVTSNDDRDI